MGLVQNIVSKLQGRSTAFFVAFFAMGNILHFLHRLDTTYITFMTALLAYVVGHSVKEDYFAKKDDH